MAFMGRLALLLIGASAAVAQTADLDSCPGYNAQNVQTNGASITADLSLAGTACNVYGNDTQSLKLEVTYETETRIHVKITDNKTKRYEVPDSVFPRPNTTDGVSPDSAAIQFNYTESPFSFSVLRKSTGEVLFSTESHPLIVEPQYLRVKTVLPENANVYGLGEHTNDFRLDPANTTITFWNRDAYGVPNGTNLYGTHPVYFEHRETGTHGVFLLNSDGMDVKLQSGSLEYNVIGGILDFYFLAGSESDPTELAQQYSELVGKSAEVPYWSFGFHQCRFGYNNYIDVANVITNYSASSIPLETMWTDIDYMDRRRIFTVDPQYFPMDRMREIVSYLHAHDQKYILMTDPAVYRPNSSDEGYEPYERGKAADVWLKSPNGNESLGLVWPGVTVYPDWFNPKTQDYWNAEFKGFYSPDTGLDIDGAWIDMNEPSSFCDLPCTDIWNQARLQALPPPRLTAPPPPDAPIFQNDTTSGKAKRFTVNKRQDPDQDTFNPLYRINNAAPTGNLSSKTAFVDATSSNGLVQYDTHNIFGTMMSTATREAMLSRRPGLRTLIITRSTFAGAGAHVGKWLGDNFSDWWHYKNSIAGILGFASIYQVPMVGADICGFAENTTETLCARWAMLGAFYPFMRNHNADTSISQEFYRWPTVAEAARVAINMRYRLIDYIYTSFHTAHTTGSPVLSPVWFKFPKDSNTFSIDTQFFYGDSILVSPVIDENSTTVQIYIPQNATFYDFNTLKAVNASGTTTLTNVNFTQIPVHIRGGAILPLRANSSMTTDALRNTSFELVVAPSGANGTATGQLYLDDGVSIEQESSTLVNMTYSAGKLDVSSEGGFSSGSNVARVRFLGVGSAPGNVSVNGDAAKEGDVSFDSENSILDVLLDAPVEKTLTVEFR